MTATLTPAAVPFHEQSVLDAFAREHLSPHHWSNAPGDTYAPHSHAYHKVLYCMAGSITFRVEGDGAFDLRPGDRLDIEPGTMHSAVVGPAGVRCVEAARQ